MCLLGVTGAKALLMKLVTIYTIQQVYCRLKLQDMYTEFTDRLHNYIRKIQVEDKSRSVTYELSKIL
jgi:hypothetical protein